MLSESPRHRNRLSRSNLGTRHVSLPDAATTGRLDRKKHPTPNFQRSTSNSEAAFGVRRCCSSISYRPGFVTAIQNCVVKIRRMRFACIERDDHLLVLEVDFYVVDSGNFL